MCVRRQKHDELMGLRKRNAIRRVSEAQKCLAKLRKNRARTAATEQILDGSTRGEARPKVDGSHEGESSEAGRNALAAKTSLEDKVKAAEDNLAEMQKALERLQGEIEQEDRCNKTWMKTTQGIAEGKGKVCRIS